MENHERYTSEESALRQAIKGDQLAFSWLYEQNISKIFNYIFYRTGNSFDAEDLTARVFHRAMSHISTYQYKGIPFSAWLYRIAHNLVANWHRDTKRRNEVPLEDYDNIKHSDELPEKAVIHSQETDMLLRAVRKLSSEKQTLIILKFVEKMPNADIALILSRTEGAVKSLYHRTLKLLRKDMELSSFDWSE